MFRSTPARFRFFAAAVAAVAVIAVDQVSKAAAASATCGDFICPLSNDGLMLNVAEAPLPVALNGIAGLVIFTAWIAVVARFRRVSLVGAAVVIAGCLSNIVDRVTSGAVRDFIVIPNDVVINLADVAIFFGLATCVIVAARPVSHHHLGGGETP